MIIQNYSICLSLNHMRLLQQTKKINHNFNLIGTNIYKIWMVEMCLLNVKDNHAHERTKTHWVECLLVSNNFINFKQREIWSYIKFVYITKPIINYE